MWTHTTMAVCVCRHWDPFAQFGAKAKCAARSPPAVECRSGLTRRCQLQSFDHAREPAGNHHKVETILGATSIAMKSKKILFCEFTLEQQRLGSCS